MTNDHIKGQWKQLSGKMKSHWGKLTDDDLRVSEGDTKYLIGKLQERYGITKEEAQRQIRKFREKL